MLINHHDSKFISCFKKNTNDNLWPFYVRYGQENRAGILLPQHLSIGDLEYVGGDGMKFQQVGDHGSNNWKWAA